jgi:hypothetical protein
MSSWNPSRHPARKQFDKDDFIFMTTEAGFCSQFNNYLYSIILAKKFKKKLLLFDKVSPVSLSYNLIKNTFFLPPTVESIDVLPPNTKSTQLSYYKKIMNVMTHETEESIRREAQATFRLCPEMAERVNKEIIKYRFPAFDLGIHIRSGDKITTKEMLPIPMTQYIAEITNYKAKINKHVLNVFVMTDNITLLNLLKSSVDASINIYSVEFKSPCINGHLQGEFNLHPRDVKEEAYIQILAELTIMQRIPALLCTLSSNIGRFLYITCITTANFKSLDIPRYAPV